MKCTLANGKLTKSLVFVALTVLFTVLCGVLIDVPVWVNAVIGAIVALCVQFATVPTFKFLGKVLEALLD